MIEYTDSIYNDILVEMCFSEIKKVISVYSKIEFVTFDDLDDIDSWEHAKAKIIVQQIYSNLQQKDPHFIYSDSQIIPWCVKSSSCGTCSYAKRNGVCGDKGSVVSSILCDAGYKKLINIPNLVPIIRLFLKKYSLLLK